MQCSLLLADSSFQEGRKMVIPVSFVYDIFNASTISKPRSILFQRRQKERARTFAPVTKCSEERGARYACCVYAFYYNVTAR